MYIIFSILPIYVLLFCVSSHYIVNMYFVNLLRIFRNIVYLVYILFSRSVSANVIYIRHICYIYKIYKDITHTVRLQSNTTSLELWITFPVKFLFLLVWCKQKNDKKVKIVLLFLMCMTFLLLRNKNSWDFFNKVRTCTRSELFASEFMNICRDFQFSVTRTNSTFYFVCKLEYRNLNYLFVY